MKLRFILTALCLCVGLSAMAQRNGNRGPRGGHNNTPQRSLDMVVDTAIINSMDLEPEIVTAVLQLQAQKAEELKAKLIEMASQAQANQGQGQGFNPEAIKAMREQMDEFKFEYRMKLRKVMGADNYITYLEKQLDQRPAMGPGAAGTGNRRRMQGGQGNWGGGQGGFDGGQGNWGGNDGGFGGGNFGGGDENNF